MKRQLDKWDSRFHNMAHLVAGWSKDPSTGVGCVLVDERRRIVSVGYNGFPRGVADTDDRMYDRDRKYLFTQHAEANAILQAVGSVYGATAYLTHPPCANCAGIMIQAGISRIVTTRPDEGLAARFADSFAVAQTMLAEARVGLQYLDYGPAQRSAR